MSKQQIINNKFWLFVQKNKEVVREREKRERKNKKARVTNAPEIHRATWNEARKTQGGDERSCKYARRITTINQVRKRAYYTIWWPHAGQMMYTTKVSLLASALRHVNNMGGRQYANYEFVVWLVTLDVQLFVECQVMAFTSGSCCCLWWWRCWCCCF